MRSDTGLRERVSVSREHAPFRGLLWTADESREQNRLSREKLSLPQPLVHEAVAGLDDRPVVSLTFADQKRGAESREPPTHALRGGDQSKQHGDLSDSKGV